MKIISEGHAVKKSIRVTCEQCEALLEITANDIEITYGKSRFFNDSFHYKCPCCDHCNSVNYRKLPDTIKNDLNY